MAELKLDGDSFYYNERGSGQAVVLVHGFPLDGRIFDDQVAGLSDEYRVIAPDLRGFGRSRSERPFSIEELADDLHALLERIGALPCVLGGLSMGGYVALAFITKYPASVRGFMLIDTKAEGDTSEGKMNRMKMVDACRAGGAKVVAEMMGLKMTASQTAGEIKDKARRIMESCPAKTIEHACFAMRERRDYRDELPSIAVPTLIIVGDSDAFAPPVVAEGMHRAIPRSELAIIPSAGHVPTMEQAGRVNEVMRGFLGKVMRDA